MDDSSEDDAPASDSPVSPEASEPSQAPKHDASGAAVIATLRTRDSELTILSGGGTMSYALVDAAGDSRTLTLDELRAYDQNLFEVVTAAMARGGAGSSGPRQSTNVTPGSSSAKPRPRAIVGRRRPGAAFIDASLDRSQRPNASGEIRAERGALGLPSGAVVPPRD